MAPITNLADYQLSNKYPPDKGDTYPFPPEENLWIHSHNAIRGEIRDIRHALEALVSRRSKDPSEEFSPWIVESLQVVWDGHYQYLKAHHHHEEVTVGAIARERFRWPEEVTHTHEDLEKKLQQVDEALNLLRCVCTSTVDKANAACAALLQAWIAYQDVALPHMQFEEETLIPLVRAYLSHWDMNKLVFKMLAMVPKSEVGAIIHYTGEEHCRNSVFPQQNFPSVLWPLVFTPSLIDYRRTIVGNMEAVRLGIKPPSAPGGVCDRVWAWLKAPFVCKEKEN